MYPVYAFALINFQFSFDLKFLLQHNKNFYINLVQNQKAKEKKYISAKKELYIRDAF